MNFDMAYVSSNNTFVTRLHKNFIVTALQVQSDLIITKCKIIGIDFVINKNLL